MTIYFSTNIPEMRAISTFNRVSTDIANIQQRITTGQRINSGKDDPGGLVIREGLRVNIKNLQAAKSSLQTTAEPMLDVAVQGMSQLLNALRGDISDPSNNGIVGALADEKMSAADKATAVGNFQKLYDSIINSTTYNGSDSLIGTVSNSKTFNIGGGETISVTLPNVSQAAFLVSNGTTDVALKTTLDAFIAAPTTSSLLDAAKVAIDDAVTQIAAKLAPLGYTQQLIGSAVNALDSQLTSITAAEGMISNADIATESSRLARSELLAQNAMNSIMYNRQYAAFAVSSLFG